jgi:phage-related protein
MRTYQATGEGKCQGQYSIQAEINRIIKDSSPDWAKKIQDLKYREAVRQKLRKTNTDWCDYKSKTCACEL